MFWYKWDLSKKYLIIEKRSNEIDLDALMELDGKKTATVQYYYGRFRTIKRTHYICYWVNCVFDWCVANRFWSQHSYVLIVSFEIIFLSGFFQPFIGFSFFPLFSQFFLPLIVSTPSLSLPLDWLFLYVRLFRFLRQPLEKKWLSHQ